MKFEEEKGEPARKEQEIIERTSRFYLGSRKKYLSIPPLLSLAVFVAIPHTASDHGLVYPRSDTGFVTHLRSGRIRVGKLAHNPKPPKCKH